jgi:hypothetical protein
VVCLGEVGGPLAWLRMGEPRDDVVAGLGGLGGVEWDWSHGYIGTK